MNEAGLADLHIHTYHSDGTYSPSGAVEIASGLGLGAVAICDHDSVAAFAEAEVAGRTHGVEIIPGVELSTHFNGKDIHILGYCFDPAEERLVRHLETFRNSRAERGRQIVSKLRAVGLAIDEEDVMREASGGAVGRPHVADAMIRRGLVRDYEEAFGRYLGYNRPAYVEKFKVSVEEAVAIVDGAGGIAVLAHPGIYVGEASVRKIASLGVRGIEVSHPKHTAGQTRNFTRLARELGLVTTGGSDCHGDRNGPPTIGSVMIGYENVEHLKRAAISGS